MYTVLFSTGIDIKMVLCVFFSIEIREWEQEASGERSSKYLISEEEEQHEPNNNKWSFSTANCTGAEDTAP
jgi:hypothetical protein